MARKKTIERAVRESKEWKAVLEWAMGELGFQLSWEAAEKVSWLLAKESTELEAVVLKALGLVRLSPDGFARPFWEDFGLKDLLPPSGPLISKEDWGLWMGEMAHAVGYPIHCPEAANEAYASERKRAWLSVMYTLTSLADAGPSFMMARLRFRYGLSPGRETEDDDPDLTILEVGELQDVASRLRKLGLKMKDKLEKSLTGESLELKDLTTSLSLANPLWFSIEGPVATAKSKDLRALVRRVVALRKLWKETVGTHFLKSGAGRPEGTGTFRDAAHFKGVFGAAVHELRKQGRNPTTGVVLRHLRTRWGRIDPGQFTRWYQGFGWPTWDDFVREVQAPEL